MKTAIAILNWNGEKLLPKFLPSVIENSNNTVIYVIDNASTDDSIKYIRENHPEVKIIQNKKNHGFAKGYNIGLQSIDADIFCLLNSDVKVTPNWLKPIQELFKQNDDIVAVQPKILSYKKPNYFEYAGAGGGFIDNLGYPFCRGRIFWTLEKDEQQYNNTTPIFWASGACLFIRRKDFFIENGFDENFFAHMEEIDLCWRLYNKNKKVYYCGQSTVYHLGGGTLQNNSPKKTFLNFRNSLLMLVKNLPTSYVLPIVFTRLCLDGVTAIVFLRYEGFKHFWAIARSHFSFYYHLPYYIKNKKSGKKGFGEKQMIPFQYFIKKRKVFNNLS